MISSTTSPDRPTLPETISGAAQSSPRVPALRSDQISVSRAEFLRSELKRQPEIRPEVVARALALAKDPSYPPMETLRKVAEQILASPDLSENDS
jgi:hypothetical protein